MKYLRALLMSIIAFGGSSAPAALAYIEMLVPSGFTWERTIDRNTGEDTFGLFLNPSVSIGYSFPDLNLDLEQPLAAPLTLSLDNPDWVNFYDGINTDYLIQVANGRGSVTYDTDWNITDWSITMDLIVSESWYGTLNAAGNIGHYGNAQLVMNYDNFQPRHFIEPYDITEFYTGFVDGFWLTDRDTSVSEPQVLPLLLAGLLALTTWRRRQTVTPKRMKYPPPNKCISGI